MKIVFFINTAAQAHFFKNIIRALEGKGHDVKILARNYGETVYLLNAFNLSHFVYADVPASKYGKILFLPYHILSAYHFLKKSDMDLIVGSGIYSAFTSFLLKKPNIVFIDAVSTEIELAFLKRFTHAILTPSNLTAELGEKHIRINSFKELAYLHPKYFDPDKKIFDLANIDEKDNLCLLRFNVFDAAHDFGVRGFSPNERKMLTKELGKYGKVLISSESSLPEDLSEHVLRISKEKIHDVLYYAKLLIADTGTMVTEAALLGTPAISYRPKAEKIGNFIELEKEYNLIFSLENLEQVINTATDLLSQKDLKKEWKVKRERLVKEKIEITLFMAWFIENFPESLGTMKKNPSYQQRFI
jgi:predicted glycosyltransferase